MQDLSTSLILLVLALVLLWLAVTDKLSRLLDAWDVLTGKTDSSSLHTVTNTVATPTSSAAFKLPSLPVLSMNQQVQV